jgi:uncharacterized membrane protein YheB (UPF0754 family)
MEPVKDILFWVLPPVVGAIIGYVTNAVAIKMLFRPLKELRLFGVRLPFTPGILPRERHKLADSIGRMVENELITPGVLRERLARTEVRVSIGNALGGYTTQMLDRPLSAWLEEQSDFPLSELLNDFFNSYIFDFFLEELFKDLILGSAPKPEDNDSFSQKLKAGFRDFGGLFIPAAATGLVKNGLTKEMKNQSKGKISAYRKALESVIERYPGLTTRDFLSIGAGNKGKADSFMALKAVEAMDENMNAALSSVNVKVLVSDRINSLDMLRVEKIIIDVMAGQLKWINFFGAILGALIGFLEVLVSYFTRY